MRTMVENTKHVLVPKHNKISEAERKELLEKYGLQGIREIPRIVEKDPGLFGLDVKEGDIVRVTRKSPTAGQVLFYRRVVHQ